MKKNTLKNLIYLQENDSCTQQTTEGLLRAIIEPVIEEKPEEALVLIRLNDIGSFSSILQRLNFTNATVYDFSTTPLGLFNNVLKENAWEKTEFIFVLTKRYGASFIFDFSESEVKGFAQYHILHNSVSLHNILDLINEHSTIDLTPFKEEFKPDRRENELMNLSIRKIVKKLNDFNQESLISNLEKETIQDEESFTEAKSSYVAHEIKNQLSIIDLYSNIIQKKLGKLKISDCNEAINAIQKGLKFAYNSLMDLKSIEHKEIKSYPINKIAKDAVTLAKAYIQNKDISIQNNIKLEENILVDENNFTAILINLIKNAIEAIDTKGKITLNIDKKDDVIILEIGNNGRVVEDELKKKIFDTGFSTKEKGRGLGLFICKKSIQEMGGDLSLKKSDKTETVFELRVLKG